MSRRLKVLVSAYACSPYEGSEPAVGWGFVHALSELHDLHVIVEEEKFREDIERWLAQHPQFTARVAFHFLRKRRNRWLRRLWPPSYYWYYRAWNQKALMLAQRLHAQQNFDLVHQLTMVGFREPGYLWQMKLPFVWGPVGGIGQLPWRFLTSLSWRGALYYIGYNTYNFWQVRWLRRPRLAAQRAGPGLIVATRENLEGVTRYWGVSASLLCEVGLPGPPTAKPVRRIEGEPLRLVWSGLHTDRKALNLALRALATLSAGMEWSLDVLGQGPLTERWRTLAHELGLQDRVRMHGWLPRGQALELMRSAHVMLISSLRDLTSTVTVEALALGLPVICPNHCGFGDVVDDTCGIRVPVDRPDRMMAGIADAVRRLEEDELFRRALSEGAVRRASTFDWTQKAQTVDGIYRQTIKLYQEHQLQ